MYGRGIVCDELWAILRAEDGAVLYSRGGSSSSPKLMVYPTEQAATRALNNSWTKQIIPDRSKVTIQRIYRKDK